MTTADALLAAVIATPDDDLVRLVYADYVEENGDPDRGEFIRVQCELARLPEWDRLAAELRHRERVLLARHGRRWHAPLPALDGVKWGRFHRGFVGELIVPDTATLIAHAEQAARFAPLHRVTIRELPTGEFRAQPLPWLRAFRLNNREEFRAADFERLIDSPLGEHLTELDLRWIGVENAGAEAIARAGGLKHLRRIDFGNCFVGVGGVRALAGAKHLGGLTALDFECDGSGYVEDPFITHAAVEILAGSPTFRNLTELDMGGNNPTTESVHLLLTSPNLARLERVRLVNVPRLTGEAFAPTDSPARWKRLDISHGWGTDGPALVAAVVACPQLSELEHLDLGGCAPTPVGLSAMEESPLAKSLRVLGLSRCDIDANTVEVLAGGYWPNLHHLDLSDNSLEEVGAIYLAGSAAFPDLRTINLRACKLGTEGASRLMGAPWLANLRELNLSSNAIGPEFAASFAEPPPSLVSLSLRDNDLGPVVGRAVGEADLPELTDLDLSNNKRAGNGIAAGLSASGRMDTLLTLGLDRTGLTGGGVAKLTDRPAPQLGQLQVGDNNLGDGGAATMAAADWPALRVLHIMNCGFSADGLTAIAAAPYFDRLLQVGFYGNRLPTTGPAAEKFAQGYWIQNDDPTWIGRREYDDEY